MISQVNSSVAQNVYANSASESKSNKNVGTQNAKDTDKVEQLKEAINSGEYKVDLSALSEKMADELL
ncbi:flagellar biosynthesis anti-sigma factor FlgM [Sulfurimonas sp.]|uniref:flagellar biosynthesis anti-sigma factor FlgM n=1 Tax=Sulfurimonas sp. TaxID=2022749 RepID=UPI003D0CC446